MKRFGGRSEGGNSTNKTLLTNEETFHSSSSGQWARSSTVCTWNCVKVRKIYRQILYSNTKQNFFNYSNLG